jgi:hypothetical protein
MEKIIDGTGTGRLLKINEFNRAEVCAVTHTEESACAELGNSFAISTLVVTLNSTNPHLLLYIKNTNSNMNMRVWVTNISWNGGSINHNRTIKWSMVGRPNEPTANYTAVTPLNLNFSSGNAAQTTVYKWDGVGDGMTYTGGVTTLEHIYRKGFTANETHGIPIVPLNGSLGLVVTGEEVGDVGIAMRFFYK